MTLSCALLLFAGCAQIENPFRETGPAMDTDWRTPTATDLYARVQPAQVRQRHWKETSTEPESGAVIHGPLYFEDPFEDKGSGGPIAGNKPPAAIGPVYPGMYRVDWEDAIATPYGPARFVLNTLGLPVSLVVIPPWTLMVSDGYLSRQVLGFDHDAEAVPVAQKKSHSADAAQPAVGDPVPTSQNSPAKASEPTQSSANQQPVEVIRLSP